MARPSQYFLFAALIWAPARAVPAQTPDASRTIVQVRPGERIAVREERHSPFHATKEIEVGVDARLLETGTGPGGEGSLTLSVVSQMDVRPGDGSAVAGPRLVIHLPLSSTADVYGESRSCQVSKEGVTTFEFSAGLDEKNFIPFTSSPGEREFRFLINKYLCRALAAPFACKSSDGPATFVDLPRDMTRWRVGLSSSIQLQSRDHAAKAEVSSVSLTSVEKTFDYETCEAIAPSSGLCCVQHKTTEWHCGGTPAGEGWHKVSGDCWHRETGGNCTDNQPN